MVVVEVEAAECQLRRRCVRYCFITPRGPVNVTHAAGRFSELWGRLKPAQRLCRGSVKLLLDTGQIYGGRVVVYQGSVIY